MIAGALTREIKEAGVGVGRLMRYDPRWPEGFNPTTGGFVRSFLGPLLGLPFYLVVSVMFADSEAGPVKNLLWSAGLSHTLNALAYPLLIGVLARPLGIGAGYAGFIIIVNWASLFLDVCAGAASLMMFGGRAGSGLFTFVWLILFAASLFITWRAARETLSPEVPIALLMVVLSVAVGALLAQGVGLLLGVAPPG